MERRLAYLCSVLGFTGVGLGALGAHAVKTSLKSLPDAAEAALRLQWWDLAARYHLAHALAVGLAAVLGAHVVGRFPALAAWCFTLGVLLFSGSLYLMALTGLRLGLVTPLGGLAFLAGWAALGFAARGLGRTREAPRPGEP